VLTLPLLRLEDIRPDEHDWLRPFVLRPVRGLFPLRPTLSLCILLPTTAFAVFRQRPLEDASDRRSIFVSMQGDHPARFHGDQPQPELATLHAVNFRTEVDSREHVGLYPLILGWGSLLRTRRHQPHEKPAPYKAGGQENESFRVHAGLPFHLG
jgi:hypothetical protein